MMATHIQRTLLCGHEKHRLSNPARGVCSCSVQHVYNVRPSRVYTQMYKNEMSAVWNGDVGCLTQRCQLVEIERSAIWNKAARPTLDVRPPKTAVWKQSCQTDPGCQTSQNSCLDKAVRPTLYVRPPKTAVWKQSCQTHPGCQTSQNSCLETKLSDRPWVSDLPKQLFGQSCQTHPVCQTSQNSCLETKLSDPPWVSDLPKQLFGNKAVRPTLGVRPPKTAVWKQSCQTHPGCQTSQNSCLETKLSDPPCMSDLLTQLLGNKAVRPTLYVRPPNTAAWKWSCQTQPGCQTSQNSCLGKNVRHTQVYTQVFETKPKDSCLKRRESHESNPHWSEDNVMRCTLEWFVSMWDPSWCTSEMHHNP